MKLTNKLNLPQPIYDAVARDPYTRGTAQYSVTGLLKPPRISQLEKQYWDVLEEDVTDRLWSLYGQIGHLILERAEKTAMAEKRLYMTIDGVTISGQMDRFVLQDKKLQDYKFVALWKLRNGPPIEFIEQVNTYVYLLRQNGFEVDCAEIVGMLRDWHKPSAKRDPDYPQLGVMVLPVEIWHDDWTLNFIRTRIWMHEKAKETLPDCSEEDRWATPDEYRILKPGGKRAVAKYHDESKALAHVRGFPSENYHIDFYPGESKRCLNYCNVAPFCDQWKALQTKETKAA